MKRYLVVANQTLGGRQLAHAIAERAATDGAVFHVVVPASRPSDAHLWSEGEARANAKERLTSTLAWFTENGWTATGEVGDQQPMAAISDALIAEPFNEIILSTLPAGPSRWLRQDLPNRARRAFGLPLTHVVGEPLPVRATA